MDQRLIGICLSRILSGFYIFIHNNVRYKLVYPDIYVKYEAELYAQQAYEDEKFSDWIYDDHIIDSLVSMGVWTYNGDDNLKNIENQIEDLKVDLYKSNLNPAKIKSLRRSLSNIKNTYNRLYSIRHSLDRYAADGYSQLLKNNYILIHSLYYSDSNRVFENVDNGDSSLLESLSNIIANNTIDISIFRKIARSDLWRNYWNANQQNLFDKATINWTDEQKTLVVLTKMYDSAREHPECPSDSVFEDDDMFDGWAILQRRESEKTKNKNRTEKMLEGKNLNKAGEIFITANSVEEAKNIYGLNDATSRHIIREREAVVQNRENINDAELPDVRRNITIQSNEQFKNNFRK